MNELKIARAATRIATHTNNTADVIERHLDRCRLICDGLSLVLDDTASRAAIDVGMSGHIPWRNRPGLAAHYEAALRNEFAHLVVSEMKHLGRDQEEIDRLVAAFEAAGVAVYCSTQRLTETPLRTIGYIRVGSRKQAKKKEISVNEQIKVVQLAEPDLVANQ